MSDSQSPKGQNRELPSVDVVRRELQHRFTMRWKPVVLTFEFKIRKPSAVKRTRLLRTASYVTNLKSLILEYFKEDYLHPRSDGAIALVLSVEGSELHRSNTIGDYISSKITPHLDVDSRKFASRMRQGACRAAATTMINWVQNIASFLERRETTDGGANRTKKREHVLEGLTLETIYEGWRRQAERYEQAAETIIPFGRHKGIPIREIGRREARWLLSRLLPKAEIERTLGYVDQLLNKDQALVDDALFAPHPFRTDNRRKRALHASRLIQRVLDPINSSEPILLGLLQADELVLLRSELREQLATGAVLDEALPLPQLQEVLAETVAVSEGLKTLEEAFETFLYGKPINYPSIAQVDAEGGLPAQALEEYKASLKWFRPNPDRLGDAEKYAVEKLEARAREHFERTSGRVREPKLQPIPFIGTIKPAKKKPSFRDCALLFDEETFEYVFVAMLRGEGDPLSKDEIAQRKALPQSAERWGKLRYANFPLHRFQMPESSAVELYPLEWGETSARNRFLRKRDPLLKGLIDRQRQAQEENVRAARLQGATEAEVLLASLKVESIFTTARIVTRQNGDGKAEFYVQLVVKPPEAQRHEPATTVIGVHEHLDGYSYAIIGLDGQPQRGPDGEEQVGDIRIPAHVDPTLGVRKSKNVVFEIANAIIRQADGAFIGLEDTGYRKVKSDLSRERNREIFQRPSKKIVATLDYKARLAGLPTPLLVRNMSPSRDCSGCGVRLPKDTSGIRVEYRASCPNCTQSCIIEPGGGEVSCSSCHFTWNPARSERYTERLFVCPRCSGSPRLARHNTAIVVAQETLRSLQRRIEQGEQEPGSHG